MQQSGLGADHRRRAGNPDRAALASAIVPLHSPPDLLSLRDVRFPASIPAKEDCVVKLRLRDNESVQEAVKRFRKLVEHAGIKKEMRRREYYEKPSDQRRRARRRAERRARIARISGM